MNAKKINLPDAADSFHHLEKYFCAKISFHVASNQRIPLHICHRLSELNSPDHLNDHSGIDLRKLTRLLQISTHFREAIR